MAADRGDIVLGWLTKLVLVLSVLGVIGFDLIALGLARFRATDHATNAARAAAISYATAKSVQAAYDAAVETTGEGETIETETFQVSPDGTITLRLHLSATTLLVEKIGPLKKYTEAVGTGEARRPG